MHASTIHFYESLLGIEAAVCLVTLAVMWLREPGSFGRTRLFLGYKLLSIVCMAPVMLTRLHFLSLKEQYAAYFWIYWTCYLLEAFFSFLVITELFHFSLEPLPGLRRLGMLVFRWAASISVLISVTAAITPRMSSAAFIVALSSTLQRTVSLLEICLLLFLYVIAKPLGMSYRSRLLGLNIGLGVLALNDLIMSAWIGSSSSLYSAQNVVHAVVPSIAMVVWLVHFMLPEPLRVPIMLPVKSPLLRWNEIAESLGKSGGRMLLTHKQEIASKDFAALDNALELLKREAS